MNIPECFSCAGESMPFREFASTEGLVIHVPFLYQSVSPFLKTAAAPVLIPPQDLITSGQKGLRTYLRIQWRIHHHWYRSPDRRPNDRRRINLGQVLPTGRGQGGCQHTIAVGRGIARGTEETELETLKATRTRSGISAMRMTDPELPTGQSSAATPVSNRRTKASQAA